MIRVAQCWRHLSVRHKLLMLALLPLLGVLPLLMGVLVLWTESAFDQLLITKVRSDLAVAHGYFSQVRAEVGAGTRATAESHALVVALNASDVGALRSVLAQARQRHRLDFATLYTAQGQPWVSAYDENESTERARSKHAEHVLPPESRRAQNALERLSSDQALALAPHLAARLNIALVPTQGAAPTARSHESRALMLIATEPVRDAQGQIAGWLRAGVLLNQNLEFIDHLNQIVYPPGSLPLGSQGTATLFLDDVRITTNVRLFQNQRAIGTRVSQAVQQAVLVRGQTWLDRAFVVNDWYVSAYEPLQDAAGERVGMLYVGFLERPFQRAKLWMLGLIAMIFAAALLLAAWTSLRWARSIFLPLEQMTQTMRRVQQGQNQARVPALPQRDELTLLAEHLNALLDAVDNKTRELQRWNAELDAQVAARTAALRQAQAQLFKSEKLAAIGQLTASVAHEINNPIAVIQGNLDVLNETLGPQAEAVQAEIKLIDQQIDRMRTIVTQLLQYARPTDYAGYVAPVDINALVRASLVLVEHLINRQKVTVHTDLRASQAVAINRQELQQVLINLMINALQAMPDGGTLSLGTRDQPNASGAPGVEITVADTGSGLDAAVRTRLFTPFFTTKAEGNGLGLWISLSLLERYGASLSAHNRSELGLGEQGAVFTTWLPLEPQDTPSRRTADAVAHNPGPASVVRPRFFGDPMPDAAERL
ncbi:MAG: cache domain-containing protein [Rhodoferax sp.]